MIASTLVAATLAAAQPQPGPAMDHSKMEHGTMHADKKAEGKMDCCKDGCACCAKDKAKPTS
jgi:uncharacterized protein involved in copper resistance